MVVGHLQQRHGHLLGQAVGRMRHLAEGPFRIDPGTQGKGELRLVLGIDDAEVVEIDGAGCRHAFENVGAHGPYIDVTVQYGHHDQIVNAAELQ